MNWSNRKSPRTESVGCEHCLPSMLTLYGANLMNLLGFGTLDNWMNQELIWIMIFQF
jgi:hypothetical protein